MKQTILTTIAAMILIIFSSQIVTAQAPGDISTKNGVKHVLGADGVWYATSGGAQASSNQFSQTQQYGGGQSQGQPSVSEQNAFNAQRQNDDVHDQNVANKQKTNAETVYIWGETLGNAFSRVTNYDLANRTVKQNGKVVNFFTSGSNNYSQSGNRHYEGSSNSCDQTRYMGDMNPRAENSFRCRR